MICNNSFLRKLSRLVGKDVILLGKDGMSYYGRLKSISRQNRVLLIPALLSSSGLVEILNPAEVQAVENRSAIDASDIIGFGFDITADPFVIPNDDAEAVTTETTETAVAESLSAQATHEDMLVDLEATESNGEYTAKGSNIDDGSMNGALAAKSGELVTISSLGGFLVAGILKNTSNETARLSVSYIFAPGGDGSTLFAINEAVVNLQAATAVSS